MTAVKTKSARGGDDFGLSSKKTFQSMRLKMTSCSQEAIDRAVELVTSVMIQITGPNSVVGPIHLPCRKNVVVVNSGPHVHGGSKEKVSTVKHSRLIQWLGAMPYHEAFVDLRLPSGVSVEVKLMPAKSDRKGQ